MKTEWKVAVGGESTTAVYEPAADGNDEALFICAHGAGGNMSDKGLLNTAAVIRANGIGVVRYNFLYKEHRRGRPDPMPRLMSTVAAVAARARTEMDPKRLIIGGRSMGGRAASMLAADGFAADGLLLLAYPLHPPGKPEQLRDAHLPGIKLPVLCFNGTRDVFCTPELMQRVLQRITAPWDMRWIDAADHGFHVLKSSGRTDDAVMAEIGLACGVWVRQMGTG